MAACAATVPCGSCPWRRSNPTDASRIPHFSIELMRRLANTVGPDDAFRPIFACHGSPVGAEQPCVGYLTRHGWTNLAVRMAVIGGRIDLAAIDDACAGVDLWPDFPSMLAAYEGAA